MRAASPIKCLIELRRIISIQGETQGEQAVKIEETIRYTGAYIRDKTPMGDRRDGIASRKDQPISLGVAEIGDLVIDGLKMIKRPCVVIIQILIEED